MECVCVCATVTDWNSSTLDTLLLSSPPYTHPPPPAPAAGSCRLPHFKRIVCLWNNQRRVKWESKWLAWLNGNQVQFFSALLVKTGVFSENNTRLMQNSHFSNNNTVKNRPLLFFPYFSLSVCLRWKQIWKSAKSQRVPQPPCHLSQGHWTSPVRCLFCPLWPPPWICPHQF